MEQNDRLSGWKDISVYLGKSVRTVQRWERTLGLPVRRISTQGGEIIFAFRSELSDWLMRQGNDASESAVSESADNEPSDEPDTSLSAEEVLTTQEPVAPDVVSRTPFASLHRSRLFWAFTASVAVITLLLALNVYSHGKPSGFDFQGKSLIVRDERGKVLWHHAFDAPIAPMLFYNNRPLFWTGDIDDDGYTEVLFAFMSGAGHTAVLNCFSESGKLRWSFSPGKKVRTATEEFGEVYGISGIRVTDTAKGRRILVSALQYPYYPSQLAVLNVDGKLLSEYWHSGHINFFDLVDLDGDGTKEIVGVGVDNGYKQATLFALDLDNVTGASAETNPKYQLLDMPLAHERARLLFPRTCVNKVSFEYNSPAAFSINPERITVHLTEAFPYTAVVYEFDYNLKLRSFSPGDGFRTVHREMYAQGKLDHPMSDAELFQDSSIRRLTVPSERGQLLAHHRQ